MIDFNYESNAIIFAPVFMLLFFAYLTGGAKMSIYNILMKTTSSISVSENQTIVGKIEDEVSGVDLENIKKKFCKERNISGSDNISARNPPSVVRKPSICP